jgi:hypothetical protein
MQNYQQRVVDEKSALDEKIEKLKAFSTTKVFADLLTAEQVRMLRQRAAMQEYSDILGERVAAF